MSRLRMTLIHVFLSPSTNHDIYLYHLITCIPLNSRTDGITLILGGMTLILGGMTLFSLLLSHVSPSTDGMTLILGGMTLFSLLLSHVSPRQMEWHWYWVEWHCFLYCFHMYPLDRWNVIPPNISVIPSVERHTYRSCQYKCHVILCLVIMWIMWKQGSSYCTKLCFVIRHSMSFVIRIRVSPI